MKIFILSASVVAFFILLIFVGLYPGVKNFNLHTYEVLIYSLFTDIMLFIVSLIAVVKYK